MRMEQENFDVIERPESQRHWSDISEGPVRNAAKAGVVWIWVRIAWDVIQVLAEVTRLLIITAIIGGWFYLMYHYGLTQSMAP